MFKLAWFFAVLAAVCGAPQPQHQKDSQRQNGARIVGGTEIDISDVPWQVGVLYKYEVRCGGSIITSAIVLTSAHCLPSDTPGDFRVHAGSSDIIDGGEYQTVVRMRKHPSYYQIDDNSADYDIAILFLARSITAKNASPIALPASESGPAVGEILTASGWGLTVEGGSALSDQLRTARVPVVDGEECRAVYGPVTPTERMICVGFLAVEGTCQGDSGGPVVLNNTLVGIVSGGYGCARADYPNVYTNVAPLVDWIQTYV